MMEKAFTFMPKYPGGGRLPPCNPISEGPVLLDTVGSDKVSDNELLHPKFSRKNNALANHFFADLLVYILFSNYILILCTYPPFCSFNFLLSRLLCLYLNTYWGPNYSIKIGLNSVFPKSETMG